MEVTNVIERIKAVVDRLPLHRNGDIEVTLPDSLLNDIQTHSDYIPYVMGQSAIKINGETVLLKFIPEITVTVFDDVFNSTGTKYRA